MFNVSTGEKSIDLNDAISEAAELYCNRAKSEGEFYNQDRVAYCLILLLHCFCYRGFHVQHS